MAVLCLFIISNYFKRARSFSGFSRPGYFVLIKVMTSAGAVDDTGRHGTIQCLGTYSVPGPGIYLVLRKVPQKWVPEFCVSRIWAPAKSWVPDSIILSSGSHPESHILRDRDWDCPGSRPLVDGKFQRFLKKAFISPKNVRKIKIKKIIAVVQISSIGNKSLWLRSFFEIVDCIFNILKLIKIRFVPSLIREKSRCSICKHMTNIKLIWIK